MEALRARVSFLCLQALEGTSPLWKQLLGQSRKTGMHLQLPGMGNFSNLTAIIFSPNSLSFNVTMKATSLSVLF